MNKDRQERKGGDSTIEVRDDNRKRDPRYSRIGSQCEKREGEGFNSRKATG